MALLGVALLEYVWPCWKECITVDIGFDISYAQANPSVTVDFLLPGYQLLASTLFSSMLSCSPTG